MRQILSVLAALLLATSAMASDPPARIALGSCADQKEPQPIWAGIRASNPDLFLFLGDNVYADTHSPDAMRAAYESLDAIEGYRRLKAEVPIEATWDDHDYGLNDGGADYSMKATSAEIFLDFFGEPADSARRASEGIYAVREYGEAGQRLQVILLDTRYFRSPWTKSSMFGRRYKPDPDPALTMLGEAQWAWLEAQLARPADVRLIASSIQVINDEHGYETWGNFPAERERLFGLIRSTGAGGVILLSGDRHFAEISAIEAGLGYPLIELTASGMTHAWAEGPDSTHSRRVAAYGGKNFGLIEIDWAREDPLVTLTIRDIDGNEVAGLSRALSMLRP